MAQWVEDQALLWLQLRFDPWPGNFHMPQVWPKKERMKGIGGVGSPEGSVPPQEGPGVLASASAAGAAQRERKPFAPVAPSTQFPSSSSLPALLLVSVGAEGTLDHWICGQPAPRPPPKALMT